MDLSLHLYACTSTYLYPTYLHRFVEWGVMYYVSVLCFCISVLCFCISSSRLSKDRPPWSHFALCFCFSNSRLSKDRPPWTFLFASVHAYMMHILIAAPPGDAEFAGDAWLSHSETESLYAETSSDGESSQRAGLLRISMTNIIMYHIAMVCGLDWGSG